jgi:hypothetical protein
MSRYTVIVVSVAMFGVRASAEDAVVKDLRPQKQGDAKFFVVFTARAGVPGHAMVVLGKEDDKKQMCTFEAFGFYPAEGKGAKAVLGPVPGKIADEMREGKGTGDGAVRLILKVDEAQFNKVDAVRKKWAAKKDYQLLNSDCITFVETSAKELGLQLPKRETTDLPTAFVVKLRDCNK